MADRALPGGSAEKWPAPRAALRTLTLIGCVHLLAAVAVLLGGSSLSAAAAPVMALFAISGICLLCPGPLAWRVGVLSQLLLMALGTWVTRQEVGFLADPHPEAVHVAVEQALARLIIGAAGLLLLCSLSALGCLVMPQVRRTHGLGVERG
jgi:hypothetical protein